MFWFKKKPTVDQSILGVIEDPRPLIEKVKDYKAEELYEFVPFDWKEKPESEWHKFPIFNQNKSSSCVGQAIAKTLGIENFLEEGKFNWHSAKDIYLQRRNYPAKGMWFQDGFKIGHKVGACFEQQMLSQHLNEETMNLKEIRTYSMTSVAKMLRGGSYLILPKDIDKVASIIEPKGKPVLIGVRFGPNEWSKDVPMILGTDKSYGHAIVGTNATLWKGKKKAIVIEDSWGPNTGIKGRRILTEEWFTSGRVTYVGYFNPLSNEKKGIEVKPMWRFDTNLRYGMIKDNEVKKLQECLAYLKMFPSGIIDYTGNFFGITLEAVRLFQETYKKEISTIVKYSITATGFVGPGTRGQLNQLFA